MVGGELLSDRTHVAFTDGDNFSPVMFSKYSGLGTPKHLSDLKELLWANHWQGRVSTDVIAAHFGPIMNASAIYSWPGSEASFFRDYSGWPGPVTLVDVSCSIWIARTQCHLGLITWTVGQHTGWESIREGR